MGVYCFSPGAATRFAAIAVPNALNELCRQFDWVQRSLIFIYVGLEQGPISFIYHPSALRASRNQIDASIAKGGLPIDLHGPWIDCQWGASSV
jgi:hypothetical protein